MKYTIVTELVSRVEEKFKSFTKKFAKYGNGEITFEKSESYYSEENKCYMTDIEICGTYKVEGYEFIGTLEYVSEQGCNLIKKINPDVEVPTKYRTSTECDHCKTRRFRKHTVLLRNIESGEFVQVGKSCVKDYLGCDIEDYARYIKWFESIDDYIQDMMPNQFSYAKPVYSVEEILLQTAERVKECGYISKAQAERAYYEEDRRLDTTASVVLHIMLQTPNGKGETIYPKYSVTDYATEYVKNVIDFIKTSDESNDYMYNLKVLFNLDFVNSDKIGMIVSAVGCYIREQYKNAEKKKREENPSKHISKVGDKLQFTATPELLTSYDTDYGVVRIYKFVSNHNEIIWKTSSYLEPNCEITLKGTIKEHSEYKGVAQTVITRCRVVK